VSTNPPSAPSLAHESEPGLRHGGDKVHMRHAHRVTWFSVERPVAGGTVFIRPEPQQGGVDTSLE
jgi:hypothetical protein